MQLLYAAGKDERLGLVDLVRRYESYGLKTRELYLVCLCQIVEVARYSVKDAETRKAKLRPTEEDKRFTPKLFQNETVQSLAGAEKYQKAIKKHLIASRIDPENTRSLYTEFAKTDAYAEYLLKPDASHPAIVLELFKRIIKNEGFTEWLEDYFPSWIDDESLIVGAVKKTIKALPLTNELVDEYGEEDRETLHFGSELIASTYKNNDATFADINPLLENWDAERVAAIDMILLKMASTELTAFPTIPTKVTINEYVDISKEYSTEKSREFVNGILDKLMRKLKEEGKIQKEGRGLVE